MIFYYVRHGDPIYDPDSLTEQGKMQSEALKSRLCRVGLDKIYASTSNRAILTAKPTAEALGKEIGLLDFANEDHAWCEISVLRPDGKDYMWMSQNAEFKRFLTSKEIRDLGEEWYTHPRFAGRDLKKGFDRIYSGADAFFKTLGYEHIRGEGKYKVLKPNSDRVALFAHQGFGIAFLSCLLDIPYPYFISHFDLSHTGVTVIEFAEEDGFCVPTVLTLSNDSHLLKNDLPLKYNNLLEI